MQVGMTKDQGLFNKPSAAVHPGALAAGTLPQYNTIQYNKSVGLRMYRGYIFQVHGKFLREYWYTF